MYTFPRSISTMWKAVMSRIWTRVTVSISDDGNHHTTNTFGTYIHLLTYRNKKITCIKTSSSFNLSEKFIDLDTNIECDQM